MPKAGRITMNMKLSVDALNELNKIIAEKYVADLLGVTHIVLYSIMQELKNAVDERGRIKPHMLEEERLHIDVANAKITMDAVIFFAVVQRLQEQYEEQLRREDMEKKADELGGRGIKFQPMPETVYPSMSYTMTQDLQESGLIEYVSKSTLAALGKKIGSTVIYDASDVEQILERQEERTQQVGPKKPGRPPGRKDSYRRTQPPRNLPV
jgi:hypothetical protein